MAQAVDAAGKVKSLKGTKKMSPGITRSRQGLPAQRSGSGLRQNHVDHTAFTGIVDSISSAAKKLNERLSGTVAPENRMTVSPTWASTPSAPAGMSPSSLDMHGLRMDPKLSDRQIADMREQEIIGPAISDLYSALNQPVDQKGRRGGVSYEAGGEQQEIVGPAPSETAPEPEPAAQPRSERPDSDQTPASQEAYVPVSPKDRRGIDWASAMAPISDAMYDAASWFKNQAKAPVPDTSHSGRSSAWRSLGETLGTPIDRYIDEHDTDGTGAYVPDLTHSGRTEAWRSIGETLGAPIDRHWDDVQNYRYEGPAGDKPLPTAEPGSMMSEAGQFDESPRVSPLQNAVDSAMDSIADHWDDVQNYRYEGPAGDKPLPTVDQWTQMSDAGQFDESPNVSLLDAFSEQWRRATEGATDAQRDAEEAYSVTGRRLPYSDISQVSPTSEGFEPTVSGDETWHALSDLTGLYVDPDMVGRTDENQAYEDFFIANGADADDVRAMANRNDSEILSSIGLGGPREYDNSTATGDASVIDDGTSYDYDHATSNFMTGTQYLKYREELGIAGRPIEDIDPRAIYSKQQELIDYGFIPYTPDWMSAVERNGANLMLAPGRLAAGIGNVRQSITPDYKINVNGIEVSGRDFDRKATPYIQQIEYHLQTDPERYMYVYEFPIEESDGTTSYHHSWPIAGETTRGEDGRWVVPFEDGTVAVLSEDLSADDVWHMLTDTKAELVKLSEARGDLPDDLSELDRSAEDGGNWMTYQFPDLVLSDGTRIPYLDAFGIYTDTTVDDDRENEFDDGITYSFSEKPVPFWFDNKPARLSSQELFNEHGFDLRDIGNKAMDFTAGSIPISLPGPIPWIFSAPSSIASLAGVDPSSYSPDFGSYLPIAGYYDDNGNMRYGVQALVPEGEDWMALDPKLRTDRDTSDWLRYWNTAGNMLVPFTEQIAGNVGSDPMGRLFHIPDLDKIASPTFKQLLASRLWGPGGEGVEEIVGNVFDEATNYGPSAWANPALDDEGNIMTDAVGHEIRDMNTSALGRAANALDPFEAMNAFAGGALVSEVMGLPGLPGRLGNYANAAYNQRRMNDMGISPYVVPEESVAREIPEEYFDESDDEPIVWKNRSNVNALAS